MEVVEIVAVVVTTPDPLTVRVLGMLQVGEL